VGERILTPPRLGRPVGDAGGSLHVVITRGRRQARRLARAFARTDRGLAEQPRPFGLDTALVDRLRLDVPRRTVRVATDGEIRRLATPLEFRLQRGALNLVVSE
jgi:hypothetical protein